MLAVLRRGPQVGARRFVLKFRGVVVQSVLHRRPVREIFRTDGSLGQVTLRVRSWLPYLLALAFDLLPMTLRTRAIARLV